MKKTIFKPGVLVIMLTALIICLTWSKIVFHPNAYLLCTGGDAFKNYYTPAWYVAYDHGIHFTGMNYPYGEHVVFTDDQPVITGILNLIDNHLFRLSEYTIGILNILMFLSLVFCVYFIFKILVHYKLPPYYAAAASILIGLMNPQLDRFWGHFALTYAVFLPLVWYLMIRLKASAYAWPRLLFTTAVIIFFGFIHMYYVLIAGMFVFFYLVAVFFRETKKRKQFLGLLFTGAVPLLFITLFIRLTDSVTDRPQSPYGFFRYKASFQSVFLGHDGLIKNTVSRVLHLPAGDAEGYAYVGMVGLLFLFVLALIFIKRYFYKHSIKRSFINLPGDLGTWFIAGICMLLFSMALPFSLGLEFLLDILSPLKQFRSPGRFAWGFYFTYTISIAAIIYMVFKKIKKRQGILAYLFICGIAGLQMYDSGHYFITTAKGIQKGNAENPFVSKNTYFTDMFQGTPYSPENFDAILFLPSFFQGSEKLYVDRTNGSLAQAMEISWHTGLPLVDQMMSRTSFSQTLNNAQLVSHPYIANQSKDGVFNAKNLLVVTVDKPMLPGEQFIIDHSVKFAEKTGFTFYAFNMDSTRIKGDAIAIADREKIKDALKSYPYANGTYYCEQPIRLFYRDGFDAVTTEDPFRGKGSFISDHKKKLMADIPVSIDAPIWIEASFWAKSTIATMAFPYIELEFLDEHKNRLQLVSVAPTRSTDVMAGWVRASENFELQPVVRSIRISCSDDSPVNFDELVVRHTAYSAYYEMADTTRFIVNNFIIGK